MIIKINGQTYDSKEWNMVVVFDPVEKRSIQHMETHNNKIAYVIDYDEDTCETAYDDMDSVGWYSRTCDMCGREYMYAGNPLCVRCARDPENDGVFNSKGEQDVSEEI